MSTYQAVVTTGIYCRPDCAARPNRENVRGFGLPAAAEAAGFRACLRCRPYRSSDAVSLDGASELVCRAVQLIVDGALDGGTEPQLAARLAVSARHLRRLFVAELGVTPDGLARSRRAHFARRLLDDTDLTVTEIAYAAGFGSVRQFNRTCREIFHASPSELRARRRRSDRLVADGGLVLRLPFHGPLDWDATTRYLGDRAIPGVESVSDGVYRRTIVVQGHPGALELSRGGDDHLLLRAHLPRWEGLIHIVERVRRLAGLDAEVAAPAAALADDPVAGPLLTAAPGIRPVGAWDGFEVGVRAILGQQVSVRGATTLAGRLVERFGTPVAGLAPFGLTHAFPSADALASVDPTVIGIPVQRAAAVRALADAVAADRLRLDRSRDLDTFVVEVASLPGIGEWTAHYLAYRLGEPDAFPASDLGLRRAVNPDEPPTARELARLSDAWRPWRAPVAARLWMDGAVTQAAVTSPPSPPRPAAPGSRAARLAGRGTIAS